MATVVVFYMIVGMPEGPFPVQIGLGESVGSLQIAIKDINSNLKNIDIDKLQLFLAKTKGGEWLSADDEAVTSLLSGDTPELVKKLMNKEMAPTDPVKDFFEDAPTTRTIHVLVKVKESLPVFRPWTLANAKFSPLSTNSSSPVLHIPKVYAKGSGLRVGKDELLLYRRKEVIDEWEALDAAVVETYAQLWIVGPPRTGKSCAAFAFACSLKRVDDKLGETKDVLWISCSKGSDPELKCIIFRGQDEKQTCSVLSSDLPSLLGTLQEETVVFLDGYTNAPGRRGLLGSCVHWRHQNKLQRRLVVITSMVSLGKGWRPDLYQYIPSKVTDSVENTPISYHVPEEQKFDMFSWTLDEYQEALKLDLFFLTM